MHYLTFRNRDVSIERVAQSNIMSPLSTVASYSTWNDSYLTIHLLTLFTSRAGTDIPLFISFATFSFWRTCLRICTPAFIAWCWRKILSPIWLCRCMKSWSLHQRMLTFLFCLWHLAIWHPFLSHVHSFLSDRRKHQGRHAIISVVHN